MADRNVREPAQALTQRLTRLEERVRAMGLRTWPGAIRTGSAGDVVVDAGEGLTPVVSVDTTAGRWVVFGHATLGILVPSPIAAPRLALSASDPTTGDVLTGDDFDFVGRRSYVWTPDTFEAPITIIGHFVSNDVVTVTLSAANDGGEEMNVAGPRLLLIPV